MGTVSFRLERFDWAAPDRMELAGRFVGLGDDAPDDPPVLVVRGPEHTRRLPAVPDSVSGSPTGGERWGAAFAWEDAPTAFEAAELELGPDFIVALPEPGSRRRSVRHQVLEVHREDAPDKAVSPAPAAERLRLQADLAAAHEETRGLRIELARLHEDLDNTRAALEAERARAAESADGFRDALAAVRASGEEALAAADEARAVDEGERERFQDVRAELVRLVERLGPGDAG
jgi:hypothetical protein